MPQDNTAAQVGASCHLPRHIRSLGCGLWHCPRRGMARWAPRDPPGTVGSVKPMVRVHWGTVPCTGAWHILSCPGPGRASPLEKVDPWDMEPVTSMGSQARKHGGVCSGLQVAPELFWLRISLAPGPALLPWFPLWSSQAPSLSSLRDPHRWTGSGSLLACYLPGAALLRPHGGLFSASPRSSASEVPPPGPPSRFPLRPDCPPPGSAPSCAPQGARYVPTQGAFDACTPPPRPQRRLGWHLLAQETHLCTACPLFSLKQAGGRRGPRKSPWEP